MNWKIDIAKMAILPKSNLHIQCNPFQNSNDLFFRINEKATLQIHMELRGAMNSQNDLENGDES